MSKKKKSPANKPAPASTTQSIQMDIFQSLHELANRRTGGAVNIRGIGFQLLYSTWLLLDTLNHTDNTITIRLEGIEDVDIRLNEENRYLQVKTSVNTFDASTFWNMKVLQNFLVTHNIDKSASFVVIHDTLIAKGHLSFLNDGHISEATLEFWGKKFSESNVNISQTELRHFLTKISAQKKTENELYNAITDILYRYYSIRLGLEKNYVRSLFYHIYDWAKQRMVLGQNDIKKLIQEITDSYSAMPINQAIQNEWITPISYSASNKMDLGYYDGKAAKPTDIAMGLNARRPEWELKIESNLQTSDIVLVRSSSGQGKSTLAYQVGKNVIDNGASIYGINYCPTYNEAVAIADFVESRVRIGEMPVIIIDGLSQKNGAWNDVVDRLRNSTVKTIITSREEDWKRYGAVTAASMSEVNISLSMSEAEQIYKALRSTGKIDNTILDWQPVWERVKEKGLLIEYVFLLTQGQMIHERLLQQVRTLGKEDGSREKLEILRIVALADVLNLKLKTSTITKYVEDTIKFSGDRNEVYQQLEKEYYIQFKPSYVEGLHPVRSMHLVQILHSNIDIIETFIALLKIIDEDSIYDYFMNSLLAFPELNLEEFCEHAATQMAKRKISEMVFAIDGIMHAEPLAYWAVNKALFDEAYSKGGLFLFAADAIPFNKTKSLPNFASSMADSMGDNFRHLAELTNNLSPYTPEKSAAYLFAKKLGRELEGRSIFESLEGIAFLAKWFNRLKLSFPQIVNVDEINLLELLEQKDIGEVSEICQYVNLLKPEKYRKFVDANLDVIISWLKRKTNSLSISVQGNEIIIEYIIDGNVADKVNDLSVYRIEVTHKVLPYYSKYCTRPLYMPFPNEEIYRVLVAGATKNIPPDALYDNFDVHVNQIWLKTFEARYAASTVFEWQKEIHNLRLLLLEACRNCIRLCEAFLESNKSRQNSFAQKFIDAANSFLDAHRIEKAFPSDGRKYFDKSPFTNEEKKINDFFSSFRNFLNQVTGIFTTGDFHLPVINLNNGVDNLPDFQDAFESIAQSTFRYFDTAQLIHDEIATYQKLVRTIRFFRYYKSLATPQTIVIARNEIERWWEVENENQVKQLKGILAEMEEECPFTFVAPTNIREHESIKYATIGVIGCTPGPTDDLFLLSQAATRLMATDIQFFSFLFLESGKTSYGLRISREYLQKFIDAMDGKEPSTDDWSTPLPIYPTSRDINMLPGVSLNAISLSKENEDVFKAVFEMWHLMEYRNRLNPSSEIEAAWLKDLESDLREKILASLEKVHELHKLQPWIEETKDFVSKKKQISKERIVEILFELALLLQG